MSKEIEEVDKSTQVVAPVDVEQALQMVRAFDDFKNRVLTERDTVMIGDKKYVKKSGWSKYSLACNLTTEVVDERTEERNGYRIYHFTMRAIHKPTGRYAEAVGTASEEEKGEWNHPEHDVRSLAQTRAYNRAISNLVGGGEVSAEEMRGKGTYPKPRSEAKEVDAEVTVKEDEKNEEEHEVRLSEDVIRYNIKAVAKDKADDIEVWEREDEYIVQPEELSDKMYNNIDEILKTLGAKWVAEGFNPHWEIPKKEEG